MKVVVRVRPLSLREQENNARLIVDVVDDKMVVFDPKREEETFFFQGVKQKGRDMLKKQNKNTQYLFDRVFGCDSTNEQVFEGSTKNIVSSVLDGYNCSVFVYGATGAGKTFTMLGTQDNPGITFRTMVDLFKQIDEQRVDKDFEIGVSYLEVYNETVKDLLNPSSGALFLREDGGGVVVAGLKLERISDPDRMFELLEYGNKNRSQHATDANAESSRSHAVFQVFLKMKTKANAQTKMVKLSMIDLAGSERGAATGCTGVRFKEGSNINKSLLALGNCINALADGLRHIPFRDSKLTRLLKDSLGGNCQTVMIANISPAHHTIEDTHNTLKYATRAKTIKFQIKRNVVSVELHVSHYIKMVEDLQAETERQKKEIQVLKKQLEESEARNHQTAPPPSVVPEPVPHPHSHLPPAVAAAVAAIGDKIKAPAITCTVAVNTSPIKGALNTDMSKRLKEEAQNLYDEKARIHRRYLSMDSSDQVLRWRIKMKQRTIDRVQAMSSTPSRTDLAQTKVGKSVGQFTGRLNSVHGCQESVSLEAAEIDDRLHKIKEESKRLGVYDELAPHFNVYELQFSNMELLLKCQNFQRLVEIFDNVFESQDELLIKVSTLFRTYYNLVRGYGHMNEELRREHETVMRGLEGIKSVQWKQERDEVYLTELDEDEQPPVFRQSILYPTNKVGTSQAIAATESLVVSDSTAQSSLVLPVEVQVAESTMLLQSPLCSSSSNPADLAQTMDTVSMLDTLGDLHSKVDSILNTSISSVVAEAGLVEDLPCSDNTDIPLNVTFDGEANLNSTFTKEEPVETKINLNETYETQDESKPPLSSASGDKFNGTFILKDDVDEEPSETRRSSLQAGSGGALDSKKLSSPAIGSPLRNALSRTLSQSPINAGTSGNSSKKDNTSPTPLNAALLKKSQFSSSSPSLAVPSATFLKKTSSPSGVASVLKKTGPAVPSPTFAVPAAVPARIVTNQKRPVGVGLADKRKALNVNAAPAKQPGAKLVSIIRKGAVSNPKINLNTPSKVKLAWNKENRNVTTVTSVRAGTAINPPKKVVGMKVVPKPAAAPIPLNDTFTK